MDALLDPIRRHPVVSYVLLAWGIAWAYWVPMAIRGEVVTPGATTGSSHFPGLMSPLVAAVVITAIVGGRSGLLDFGRRLFRWRVPLRWYAAAALPFAIYLGAAVAMAGTGGKQFAIAELGEFSGLPTTLGWPLLILAVLVFNGYGEEGGWRGFLTPALLARRGPFTTSLIVAAVWFTWHVPSFPVIETYRNMGLAIIPMMGFGILSGAIVLTWLYVGSGGSIFIVSLWHLALNFGSATTAARGLPGIVLWNAILVWAMVVAVGWLVAGEPRNRPFLTRLRDGTLIALLRSPVGRYVHGMTVITFKARRSGRTLRTPVECVHEAGRLLVFVGHPEGKQWWRNVQANPDVLVEIDGQDQPGRATVHAGTDAESASDLGVYLEHRPRLAKWLEVPLEPLDPAALAAAAGRSVSVRIDLVGSAAR